MIAEGKEKKNLQDSKTSLVSKPNSLSCPISKMTLHPSHNISSNNMYMVGFLLADDSDFVVGESHSEENLN